MQNLFYQNFKEYKGSFIDTLHDKGVQNAITMHPVKMPIYQYRVSNHFTSRKIMDLRNKELDLQRQISEMNQVLNEQSKVENKYGLKPSVSSYIPTKKTDCLGWEFTAKSLVSHLNVNPRKALYSYHKQALEEVVSQTMDIINRNSRQRGRTIDFKDVLYGYVKTDPLHGSSRVLDILLTYRKHKGKNRDVPVRRHAYLHQTFTYTEFMDDPLTFNKGIEDSISSSNLFSHFGAGTVPIDVVKLKETIHFILPLAGKVKEFDRFMKVFAEIALRPKENAQMHVVLFTKNSSPTEVEEILNIVGGYQKKYGGHLFEVIEADGDFSRGKALDLGAKQCSENELLFCVDVDIVLSRDSLTRIRLNTIRNIQVYYPIVFSQYDPDVTCRRTSSRSQCKVSPFDLRSSQGYWRQFGYGIVAMYRSDLEKVGGYDVSIEGWGKEDVDLFDKFIQSNLTVFRAVDTGMVHAFHPIKCDTGLDPAQFQMCIGSKATCLGSQWQLAEMVLQMKDILNKNL